MTREIAVRVARLTARGVEGALVAETCRDVEAPLWLRVSAVTTWRGLKGIIPHAFHALIIFLGVKVDFRAGISILV